MKSLMVLPFASVLLAGIYLSFKSRWVQLRAFGHMWHLLRVAPATAGKLGEIAPRAALLTAMSTTIGVGNIVGPIVAIGLGGPGALLCYVLATLLGSATVFAEVSLAMQARGRDAHGALQGGPMPYLRRLKPALAPAYAFFCALLLLGWSAANANTIAMTLGAHGIAPLWTGLAVGVAVLATLAGGIGRVARLNERLVPLMCTLYCAATLWIVVGVHGGELPAVLRLVWKGFWTPAAVGWGGGLAGMAQVLRHGLARALQANEAGVGTSTIAHSLAQTVESREQATLAMAAVYFNGFLCLLTGLTVLVGTADVPGAAGAYDILLLQRIFTAHFSSFGSMVLGSSIFLFAFGTLLGNAFNGGHCVGTLVPQRLVRGYYVLCAVAVLMGSIFDLHTVFAGTDYLIVPVVLLNTTAVIILAARNRIDFSLPCAPRKGVDLLGLKVTL